MSGTHDIQYYYWYYYSLVFMILIFVYIHDTQYLCLVSMMYNIYIWNPHYSIFTSGIHDTQHFSESMMSKLANPIQN